MRKLLFIAFERDIFNDPFINLESLPLRLSFRRTN